MSFSGTAAAGVGVVATVAVGFGVGEAVVGEAVAGVAAVIGFVSGSLLSLAQPTQSAPVNSAVIASFVVFIAGSPSGGWVLSYSIQRPASGAANLRRAAPQNRK